MAARAGPLERVRAPDDVSAVFGNHDCWTDPELIGSTLSRCGVQVLMNRALRISRGDAGLVFAGVDDVYDGRADLEAALGGVPEDGCVVLLAHEPDFADEAAATGRVDLQLSGHSHGGQVNLPLMGPPFLPHLAKKYPRGHYRINGMQLYTNRCLGTTALQLRLNCPAEIAVITLRAP